MPIPTSPIEVSTAFASETTLQQKKMMLAQTEFLQKRTQFCGLSYEQKPLLLSEISPFGTAIKKK